MATRWRSASHGVRVGTRRPRGRPGSTARPVERSIPVVFHGGVARDAIFGDYLRASLAEFAMGLEPRDALADAVAGAVQFARELAERDEGAIAGGVA
jgi:hypothetical protein